VVFVTAPDVYEYVVGVNNVPGGPYTLLYAAVAGANGRLGATGNDGGGGGGISTLTSSFLLIQRSLGPSIVVRTTRARFRFAASFLR